MSRNFGLNNQETADGFIIPPVDDTAPEARPTPVLSSGDSFEITVRSYYDDHMAADKEFAALWFAFACFVAPILIGGAFLFGLFVFI